MKPKKLSDEEFQKILQNIPKRHHNPTNHKNTNHKNTNNQISTTNTHSTSKPSYKDILTDSNTHQIATSEGGRSSPQNTSKTSEGEKIKHINIRKTLGNPRFYTNRQIQQPSQHNFIQNLQTNHIYDNGKKQSLDKLIQRDKTWQTSLSNELGRVMQGIGNRITGTDTMEFVKKHEIPTHKKITYANFVCDYRPLKAEKHRVRMTIGGDKLEYENDTTSPAASLLETKLLLNSVISDAKDGARFLTMDLKDHFL